MNFKDLANTPGVEFVTWCSGCSAEQATDQVEIEIEGKWWPLDIGPDCLVRLKEQGKLEI